MAEKQVRTPSERNKTVDTTNILADKSKTPFTVRKRERDNDIERVTKRQFSQPSVPFKFQQLMVKNKQRLKQFETNLQNV